MNRAFRNAWLLRVIVPSIAVFVLLEVAIMAFLDLWAPELPSVGVAVLDALLLFCLASPIFFWLIVKPFMVRLERLASELQTAKEVAEALSVTDVLTGLFNRLKLDRSFSEELTRCHRFGEAFSVILVDLDHFKGVNDTYGHQAGDSVLVDIAAILKANTREVDTVGRWGGEEFLILCPRTDGTGAGLLAEKIRASIDSHTFPGAGHCTASFGVAEYVSGDTAETLTAKADQALYRAKDSGRNRVEVI